MLNEFFNSWGESLKGSYVDLDLMVGQGSFLSPSESSPVKDVAVDVDAVKNMWSYETE